MNDADGLKLFITIVALLLLFTVVVAKYKGKQITDRLDKIEAAIEGIL